MKFINTHHYRYCSKARCGNAHSRRQPQDAGASSQAFPRRAWERSGAGFTQRLPRRSAGFTLIEIMISLIVGAFLIGGVLQIFLNTQKTYRMQENLSRIQENGRFALEFISRDVRMAGYLGCNANVSLVNTLTAAFLHSFDKAIEGFESTSATAWSPTINPAITSPLGGSDVITIRRVDTKGFTVASHASSTAPLTLNAATTVNDLKAAGFLKDDGTNNNRIAVVSDCTDAAIFQVTGITGLVLSHGKDLGKRYSNSQVYGINTISYYIRTNPNNTPSLYKRVGAATAEELIEGIENMQLLYGVDTDSDNVANYYVKANNVESNGMWPNVISVKVKLLVVSPDDNLTVQPVKYKFDGNWYTPTDRKIRREFSSTIVLRNRLS